MEETTVENSSEKDKTEKLPAPPTPESDSRENNNVDNILEELIVKNPVHDELCSDNMMEIILSQPQPQLDSSAYKNSEEESDEQSKLNPAVELQLDLPTISVPSNPTNPQLNKLSKDPSLEDCSTDSSQIIEKSASQTCLINDVESKYLEEQANLKTQLQDKENEYSKLTAAANEKDVLLENFRQEKSLLEREKQMVKKELDLAMKEKENAVMRYVNVERLVLEAKGSQEVSEKKVKVMQKEVEVLNGKIKMMGTEKTRICGLLDNKCYELKNCQKECEKLKNDVSSLEVKSKWSSHKLKQEMDMKTAAETKIEELLNELKHVRETETAKLKEEFNVEKMISLEKQCMENQAIQILMKHGNEEKDKKIDQLEQNIAALQTQYNELKNYHHNLIVENSSNKRELDQRNDEILEVQTILDKEVMKIADLQSKLNDLETLKTQFALEKETGFQLTKEFTELKSNYEDQESELTKLREKENELLQFNKELTERCVHLQNECSLLHSKVTAITLENDTIKKDKKYYDDIIANLETQLSQEIAQKSEERIIAAKHIAEKTKLCDGLQKKIESGLGDMNAIKKKHSQTIKELNREIHNLMKRKPDANLIAETDKSQNNLKAADCERDPSQSSAASSAHTSDTESQNGSAHPDIPPQLTQPSQKSLIDRIVRLQHASARQGEKIDFLENHSANLVTELQKKSKLLHHYMLREQTGALASSKSDRNKAELSKHGGIMAAVYGGGKTLAPEITLDLSLEINRKLQAVLEDTLLKNITLKENLDTLGLEVDKLARQLSSK